MGEMKRNNCYSIKCICQSHLGLYRGFFLAFLCIPSSAQFVDSSLQWPNSHCVPLAIETIKISFKVSQLDLIALKLNNAKILNKTIMIVLIAKGKQGQFPCKSEAVLVCGFVMTELGHCKHESTS